ncbi:hypothetical protein [Floricoccus penangensis]|uniref:hypothetical protein n=1 Tax=Floricoccus penangensis TaxID=1859475 RepID=UPI0013011367|nr:hypothetical protein [Floricoccus penangensis]
MVAFTLVIPQLITRNMIMGSDSIFHFNRFYDTSQQIKEKNFQYFISMYGFEQSARIVNALYSPYIAYIHGLIVLISRSWFTYQVSSNFLLYILSGISMYVFLLRANIKNPFILYSSILYMTTYSVLYWVIRQGFSSWGAVVMPFCFSLIFELIQSNYKIPKFRLGIYLALALQVHMLSAFMITIAYLISFTFAFAKTTSKRGFICDILREIIIFILLTLNIWTSYFTILFCDYITQPFINIDMNLSTITQNSYYWLINPVFLLPILVITLVYLPRNWKRFFDADKILFIIMLVYLILSTNLIPWNYLVKINFYLAQLIQFPFRFFIPATIILIYLFTKIFQDTKLKIDKHKLMKLIILISIIQVVTLVLFTLNTWNSKENFLKTGDKTVYLSKEFKYIKESFYDKDKSKSLALVSKGTADYLPDNFTSSKSISKYDVYEEEIIKINPEFKKYVKNNSLIIEWKGNNQTNNIPIVTYKGTQLNLNNKKLIGENYSLSEIGSLNIKKDILNMENTLSVNYVDNIFTRMSIIFTPLSWLVFIILLLIERRKNYEFRN